MTSMAEKIKKSSVASNDPTRERASEQEHSRSTPSTSFRLPADTRAQLEALRVDRGQKTGRIPTATEIIKSLVNEAHEKVNK